jgi:hypothetical protein
MTTLPDPDLSLREARDIIFSSRLGRRALAVDGWPQWPLVLRDVVEAIYRLVQSCHMPEFTDHGLPHLCSLIDRVSVWETPESEILVNQLSHAECGTLLLSILVHDLGMLSQNAEDLPDNPPPWAARDQAIQVADWVRQTHVIRLPKLARRVLLESEHAAFVDSEHFPRVIRIASGHQLWPWDWEGVWQESPRNRGLAALVAVADLLDEDAARCDTKTLLRHRDGNALNRGHWLRHALTSNRVLVNGGVISIQMHRPPNTDEQLLPVFVALRNHFRLVVLYNADLRQLNAEIRNIQFTPCTGIPSDENLQLSGWEQLPEYANTAAFCHQLLRTFMPEALKDSRRLPQESLQRLRPAALEEVDLSILNAVAPVHEPGTQIEQAFRSILGGAS